MAVKRAYLINFSALTELVLLNLVSHYNHNTSLKNFNKLTDKIRMKLLTIKNLNMSYGDAVILDDLSLELQNGKFYTLLGENGAGKSSLIRLINGQSFSNSGEIRFKGKNIIGEDAQCEVEMVFVDENVIFDVPIDLRSFSKIYGEFYKNWDQDYFDNIVKNRKLDLERTFNSYSRGQKVQFALSLALAAKPEVIFCDEVTSVMDIYARKFFMKELDEFVKAGGTVIFTTNVITEVKKYATDLIILKDGKVVVNSQLDRLIESFVKLKVPDQKKIDFLNSFPIYEINENSTGYIVEREIVESSENSLSDYVTKDRVSLEELFIYFYEVKEELYEKLA